MGANACQSIGLVALNPKNLIQVLDVAVPFWRDNGGVANSNPCIMSLAISGWVDTWRIILGLVGG